LEKRENGCAFLWFRDYSHQKDQQKLQNEPFDVSNFADAAENEAFGVP
jgi:hypothetical protein